MIKLTETRRLALLSTLHEKERQRSRIRKYNTREHPFNRGSIIRQIFDLVQGGTTVESVKEFCANIGVDHREYISTIYKGFANGYEWEPVNGLDGLSGRAWKIRVTKRITK